MTANPATTPEPDPAGSVPAVPRRTATDAERRALASVLRLRILRLCLHTALTNKELAGRLDRDPATVLHHVRTLVSTGFLISGEPRPGPRGSREVPYRASGKSWQLDFRTPEEEQERAGERGSADLLLQTFLEEVAEAPLIDVSTTRLGLQLSVEHRDEFETRMRALLDEFVARGADPDGRRWSVFVAVHPEF